MTPLQVTNAAYNAGFRGNDLLYAVTISGRESDWNPSKRRTDNPGGDTGDFGLMQINYSNDTPAMRAAAGYSKRSDLLDPAVNMRVAYQLFQRSGFAAWRAGPNGFDPNGDPLYGTEAYRDRAIKAVFGYLTDKGDSVFGIPVPSATGVYTDSTTVGKQAAAGVANGVLDTLAPWAKSLAAILGTIIDPAFWKRVGIGVLGVVLLAFAFKSVLTDAIPGVKVNA